MANKKQLKSSVQTILDDVIDGIQTGRYVPGQRLITSDFAKQFGVSLAPVREAFHVLAGEGVIELLKNRGVRVRLLSKRNIIEGLQILQAVGALAIRLSGPRLRDPNAQKKLKASSDAILKAGKEGNINELFKAVSASHRLMNELADNSYLNPVVSRIHLEYFNHQLSSMLPNTKRVEYISHYKEMSKLLLVGDTAAAEKAFVEHMDWLMKVIET